MYQDLLASDSELWQHGSLLELIGCFNHGVTIIVADKLKTVVMRGLLWIMHKTTGEETGPEYLAHNPADFDC